MTKSEIISAINNMINSVENEDLIEVNNSSVGNGFVVVFDAIIDKDHIAIAEELGEDSYDEFDLHQMEEVLERTDDQLDTILKEVRKFAASKPEVGRWTRGGKRVRCTDYDEANPFVYEVTAPGVIKVA